MHEVLLIFFNRCVGPYGIGDLMFEIGFVCFSWLFWKVVVCGWATGWGQGGFKLLRIPYI